MKYNLLWTEQLKNRDGGTFSIYDLVISPDCGFLLLAADNKIYVYDIQNGVLRHTLKGHKESVLCLAFSHDSKRFASGSADKQVIIWTNKMEAILKYSHNESIRCLEYNPKSLQLLSCTVSDFGLWSPEQKTVAKTKVASQINSCSWNEDGTMFALGFNSGTVSVRLKSGEEKFKIDRSTTGAVWAVLFYRAPVLGSPDAHTEALAVADWSRSLSFFNGQTGAQVGNTRSLSFDPLFLSFMSIDQNDFFLIGGSNAKVQVYTMDGIYLDTLTSQNSWIWTCKIRQNRCAVGCENGTVAVFELSSTTVHSLFKQRYAYRDSMTDVVIQHLKTNEKVRIKCRDLVKKIAIYEKSLAIQLPERVILYELGGEGDDDAPLPMSRIRSSIVDMNYKVKEKLSLKIECSLLVLCASNLIFCQERRLESVRLSDGKSEREWTFSSPIRYIKTIGGVPKQEALTVVLKSGQITTIFLNSIFQFERLKHLGSASIRFIDLSPKHRLLALIDERLKVTVYDLENSKILFEKANVSSAAFNSDCDNVLSIVYNGDILGVVYFLEDSSTENIKIYEQTVAQNIPVKSFVIGFSGSAVYILQEGNVVTSQRVTYSNLLHRMLKDQISLEDCYKVACLNVAPEDWKILSRKAVSAFKLDIARQCFYRLQDFRFLPLFDSSELSMNQNLFEAEFAAYESQFSEAARIFRQKVQQDKLAWRMFTDLQMFEQARDYQDGEIEDDEAEAETELSSGYNSGNHSKNFNVKNFSMTESGTVEDNKILEDLRRVFLKNNVFNLEAEELFDQVELEKLLAQIDKGEGRLLSAMGAHLARKNQFQDAAEAYSKSGDVAGLAQVYSQSGRWSEALKLMFDYGNSSIDHSEVLKNLEHGSNANALLNNPAQFAQAQAVFKNAGSSGQLESLLKRLVQNFVKENRFEDSSYYCWLLSIFHQQNQQPEQYRKYSTNANIYYAYNNIYKYIEEPYTSVFIEILFNCALFLYRFIDVSLPEGVSKVNVLFALAKLGKNLKHYKLVRMVYAKLQQQYVLPARFEELIEVGSIEIKTKPFMDDEELAKFCYRCSAMNTFNAASAFTETDLEDRCFNCSQPFVYSFYSFDTLPLVEFEIDPGLRGADSLSLNTAPVKPETEPGEKSLESENFTQYSGTQSDQLLVHDSESAQIATFEDSRHVQVLNSPDTVVNPETHLSILNASQLAKLDSSSVLVVPGHHNQKRFFLNTLPEIAIVSCETCNKFFYSDEYEFQRLKNGRCPFCRN